MWCKHMSSRLTKELAGSLLTGSSLQKGKAFLDLFLLEENLGLFGFDLTFNGFFTFFVIGHFIFL